MQCLDINLPGSLSNAGAIPLAYNDALVTAGTLALWEPQHPVTQFAGVPTAPASASGATITTVMPNVAQMAARNLLGNQAADVDMRFTRNDGNGVGPNLDMLIERSGKGGLHVITSQSTMTASKLAIVEFSDAIRDYLFANLGHTYFLSAWYCITRVALANTGPYISVQRDAGASDGMFSMGVTGPLSTIAYSGNSVSPARNTVGNTIEQLANTWDNGLPAGSVNIKKTVFGFGLVDGSYGDHGRNKSFSAVLYRVFLEDLTASGRTFAAAKALDDALYAQAFAAGGRYNGDTFTSPSALP